MPEKDPTEAIRVAAAAYPDVDPGTACTQSAFRVRKKAFLYVGPQGGRYKAMFKLEDSLAEAATLAEQDPDCYEIGKGGWVVARFTAARPLPKRTWKKWLDESYRLSAGPPAGKSAPRASARKKSTRAKK